MTPVEFRINTTILVDLSIPTLSGYSYLVVTWILAFQKTSYTRRHRTSA